eukprot:877049-Pleurochrysis_carterae.AAC.2
MPCFQAILSNPSDYWISVINAGRAHSLSAIRAIDESTQEVGQVITSLMQMADVLSLASATNERSIYCLSEQQPLLQLAADYIGAMKDSMLKAPSVNALPRASMRLKAPHADGAAVPDDDAELMLLDGVPDVTRKMKKAFCEPGNANFCPPLVIVRELVLPYSDSKSLILKRRAEDGGDRTYTLDDSSELAEEFAAGKVHPGDLKPAVRDAVIPILQRAQQKLKEPALAKAEKELVKVAKRNAKGAKVKK